MKLYQLSKENGKNITQFTSIFLWLAFSTLKYLLVSSAWFRRKRCYWLSSSCSSPASLNFRMRRNVRNKQERYFKVQPGDAVFWEKGEWHETKNDVLIFSNYFSGN